MTNRPTDETTARVVAIKEAGEFKDHSRYGILNPGKIMVDPPGGPMREYPDPRDDTDEAMKLLNWLMVNRIGSSCELVPQSNGTWWLTGDYDRFIPGSGEPFRFAVVALAAEVMETRT